MEGLKGLEQLKRFYLHKQLKREKKIKDYTLDLEQLLLKQERGRDDI